MALNYATAEIFFSRESFMTQKLASDEIMSSIVDNYVIRNIALQFEFTYTE